MFKNISGLQIDIDKTKIMWLGSERHENKPCGLNCSKHNTVGLII